MRVFINETNGLCSNFLSHEYYFCSWHLWLFLLPLRYQNTFPPPSIGLLCLPPPRLLDSLYLYLLFLSCSFPSLMYSLFIYLFIHSLKLSLQKHLLPASLEEMGVNKTVMISGHNWIYGLTGRQAWRDTLLKYLIINDRKCYEGKGCRALVKASGGNWDLKEN